MEKSDCKDLISDNSNDRNVDPDYSLNDFFDEDWNLTEMPTNPVENNASNVNITEDQLESEDSRIAENTHSDYTLDRYFQEDWSYNTNTHSNSSYSNSISSESVVNIIKFGSSSDFRKLINSDYKYDVLNDKSQTAIHLLFYSRAWEYFQLLDRKFSHQPVNLLNSMTDCYGLTYLHIACAKGSPTLVEKYLSNKDDIINATYSNDPYVTHQGFTALHFAVTNPKVHKKEIVKKLIKHGANVNATDAKGRTPFHVVSRIFEKQNSVTSDGWVSTEIMDILLKNKSTIEARDTDGNTPLMSVFSLRHQEFQLEYFGCSEFDDSCHVSTYMPEIKKKFKFFLQNGADVTARNKKNENVLHLILENLKIYCLQFKEANFILDDSDHVDMIRQILLVNPKIDLDLKNNDGITPLRMAVACMSLKIVELLLDHGADLKSLKFKMEENQSFFQYPDMVVIFEPVQNLIDILDLLSSKGFNLSLQDRLEILKLLLHDAHEDDYCGCRDDTNSSIKLVLEYASNSHIESTLQSLYYELDCYAGPGDPNWLDVYNDERLHGTEELYSDLMEFLDTRRVGNIYSAECIKTIIAEIIDDILSKRLLDPTFDYKNYLERDLSSLKAINFENNVSLHDVLVKDPLEMPRYIVDEFDVKIIKNLRCFKNTIKGYITKARIKYFCEQYASDYLKSISRSLPDVCCRMIVSHLSYKDILNLGFATSINN